MRPRFSLFSLFLFFVFPLFSQEQECGTVFPAAYSAVLQQTVASLPTPGARFSALQLVPIEIHLIRKSDSTSTLSLQDIRNEISSVNVLYANAGLVLMECYLPEMINSDNLYNYSAVTEQSTLISAHFVPHVLNLYFANTVSTSSGSVCGYSFLPGNGPDACFFAASCATNGSTVAHEIGHYFGLLHTHGGSPDELVNGSNCSTEGDLICDTPADPDLNGLVNSLCAYTGTATDSNNMPYQPDTHNMMSYSRKECRTSFTPMQYAVMNATYFSSRTYLSCSVSSAAASILAYPSPVQDVLHISGIPADAALVLICIYDPGGRLVLKQEVAAMSSIALVPVGSVAEGVYIYTLSAGGDFLSRDKIVVAR